MPKNFLGRDDSSFEGATVVAAGFPSIEDNVHKLTGYRLPLIDLTRGVGALANNAAVLGDAYGKLTSAAAASAPANELPAERGQDPNQMDRIRQLMASSASRRSNYNAQQAAQGKSFFPAAQ